MKTVINFSGGRTSAYMLNRVLAANYCRLPDDYIVVFANTGRERNETLDFIHEVETRWSVPIVWLEYCRIDNEHAFKIVSYEKAARRGEYGPFDELLTWVRALPNPIARTCTVQLKIRTIQRYLKSLGLTEWRQLIGIRADESLRVVGIEADSPSYIHLDFPLVRAGCTEAEVLDYWKQSPFDLKLKSYEGNCDFCFLKSRGKLLQLIRDNPADAHWWMQQERGFGSRCDGDGARFRTDRTFAGLIAEATSQGLLNFDDDSDAIACSCMETAGKTV